MKVLLSKFHLISHTRHSLQKYQSKHGLNQFGLKANDRSAAETYYKLGIISLGCTMLQKLSKCEVKVKNEFLQVEKLHNYTKLKFRTCKIAKNDIF